MPVNEEQMWKAANRMTEAADAMGRHADRIEEAQRKMSYMFEDGYGGNALRLIELLEKDLAQRAAGTIA